MTATTPTATQTDTQTVLDLVQCSVLAWIENEADPMRGEDTLLEALGGDVSGAEAEIGPEGVTLRILGSGKTFLIRVEPR